jgi:type IV secretory pathway VirB3-like protein
VNAVSFDHLRRQRAFVGGSTALLGMVLLVVGEIATQAQLVIGVTVSLAGFAVTFVAIAWLSRHRNYT